VSGTVTVELTVLDAGDDLDLFVLAADSWICRAADCVEAGTTSGGETVVFTVEAGQRYVLVVDGYCGSSGCSAGAYRIAVSCS
jgi:hypothetical protein